MSERDSLIGAAAETPTQDPSGLPDKELAARLRMMILEGADVDLAETYCLEALDRMRTELPQPPDPNPDDREGLVEDARTVADFIVGWWPGLEDGINWGVPGERSGKTSEVYQAAKRLRDRLQAQEAGDGN